MAVAIPCPHCGAVLQGNEGLLGRTVRCARCSQTFTAAAGGGRPAAAPANAPPPVRQAAPPLSGQFPGMATGPMQPGPFPAMSATGFPSVASAPAGGYAGVNPAASQQPAAPPGRRKKSNNAVWIWGGTGAAVLVVAGVAAFALLGAGSGMRSDEMFFLPDDPAIVGRVDVQGLKNSSLGKDLATQVEQFAKSVTKDTGNTQADNIASVAFGARSGASVGFVFVMSTVKQPTVDEMLGEHRDKAKSETVGKFTMHVVDTGSQKLGFVLNGKQVIGGDTATLKSVLTRNRAAKISSRMQKAIQAANMNRHIAVAMNLESLMSQVPNVKQVPVPGLADLEMASLDISFSSDIDLHAEVFCKSSASAKNLHDMAVGALGMVNTLGGGQIPPELSKALQSMKLSHSGGQLQASLRVPGGVVRDGIKQAASLGSMFASGAGPGAEDAAKAGPPDGMPDDSPLAPVDNEPPPVKKKKVIKKRPR